MEKPPRGAEKQELEALLARLRAQEFVAAEFLAEAGAAGLPLILVDGEAVVAGRYPVWEEWRIWLGIDGGCGGCGRQAEGCAGCRAAAGVQADNRRNASTQRNRERERPVPKRVPTFF